MDAGNPIIESVKDYPVYINNRDRLSSVQQLIAWLQKAGTRRIIILDNDSSYPPLMDFYQHVPTGVRLIRFGANCGPWAFWSKMMHISQITPYVVTDADIVPSPTCPYDLIYRCAALLRVHPQSGKVGPSLLPISKWEEKFWKRRFNHQAWCANIDTTFALYGAGSDGRVHQTALFDDPNNLRLDRPYVVLHTPAIPEIVATRAAEEAYYRAHSNKAWSHC